ncbi:unnamed protein product [Malus baccata var. baccata]
MLVRVDETSYDGVSIGQNYILVNYGRFSCGADPFGPGFTNDTDLFGPPAPILSPIRYHDKFDFRRRSSPELFPGQTLDYFLRLHFVEIDPGVTEAGQRVFDILINGECHSD